MIAVRTQAKHFRTSATGCTPHVQQHSAGVEPPESLKAISTLSSVVKVGVRSPLSAGRFARWGEGSFPPTDSRSSRRF